MIVERAIHISSVNRAEAGESKPESFTIGFTPAIRLSNTGVVNDIALDVASLTYWWHNVAPRYNNDTLKYSNDGGKAWNEVKFPSGGYDFIDMNDFLHLYMADKGHMTADGKCSDINIVFFHTNFVCAVEVSGGYQLDLRETRTASILRTSTLTSYRIQLLLEGLQVRFTSSQWTTMSAAPLMVKPKRAKYNRVYGDVISQIRVTVEDPVGRLVDLNGVAWYMTLLLQTRPEDSNIV